MDLRLIRKELYALPPEQFVAVRNDRVREAKAAGEVDLSRHVAALRKPTVAAWLVNQLSRYAELDLGVLFEVGTELRDQLGELSGDDLRALTRRRQVAVTTLLARARQLAVDQGRSVGADALAAVRTSLEATLADPDAAAAVKEGCLAEPLEAGGFGFATVSDLTERRERKAAAAESARVAVADAERRMVEADVRGTDAEERLAKARRRLDKAVATVAKVRLELATAEAAEAEAGRRVERRQAAAALAADELADVRDELAVAREALERLTQ